MRIDRIKKYHILCEIGDGATSTVYLAYDPCAKRDVSIKATSQKAFKNKETSRLHTRLFLTEASLVGKLSHPNIVEIYDAVISEGFCYVVMEYVSGGTLEKYTTEWNLLPIERIVEIILKCSQALDFANRKGIIHRDIKPANLLLTKHDPLTADIKISDFGAAIVDTSERTQVSGIGSPAYMSPQQVRELPLDHRTDIYSLGVVMYQLLTGHLPFPGKTHYNIIYNIINEEAPQPSSFRKEIPETLDKIVEKAMKKDIDKRYQHWEDFSRDLAGVSYDKQLDIPAEDYALTEKFNVLRNMPFFSNFSDGELWEVLHCSEWGSADTGEFLVLKSGEDEACHFVIEGELEVVRDGCSIDILKLGDCFVEMVSAEQSNARNTNVMALAPTRFASVNGKKLVETSCICRMNFYYALLQEVTKRLSIANERLTF